MRRSSHGVEVGGYIGASRTGDRAKEDCEKRKQKYMTEQGVKRA